ncbi:hypothetical protein P7K49_005970 [Saguinus oedipus]|uniref:Uncharacterized protein n=1 Tax=Saguinus oedipus TaxID=9490 RepID=A0ABQ9W2Q0_SAGOE|nr:hypothetical protein P7K49_005970 [Saguinus oedipus]
MPIPLFLKAAPGQIQAESGFRGLVELIGPPPATPVPPLIRAEGAPPEDLVVGPD